MLDIANTYDDFPLNHVQKHDFTRLMVYTVWGYFLQGKPREMVPILFRIKEIALVAYKLFNG